MYKIINITDILGNIKYNDIENIKKNCSIDMIGTILYPETMKEGTRLCFLWNGDSGKMMRTSLIESIEEKGNILCITTINSKYYLEKL